MNGGEKPDNWFKEDKSLNKDQKKIQDKERANVFDNIDVFDSIENTFEHYVKVDEKHFVLHYTNQSSPGQSGGGVLSHTNTGIKLIRLCSQSP